MQSTSGGIKPPRDPTLMKEAAAKEDDFEIYVPRLVESPIGKTRKKEFIYEKDTKILKLFKFPIDALEAIVPLKHERALRFITTWLYEVPELEPYGLGDNADEESLQDSALDIYRIAINSIEYTDFEEKLEQRFSSFLPAVVVESSPLTRHVSRTDPKTPRDKLENRVKRIFRRGDVKTPISIINEYLKWYKSKYEENKDQDAIGERSRLIREEANKLAMEERKKKQLKRLEQRMLTRERKKRRDREYPGLRL